MNEKPQKKSRTTQKNSGKRRKARGQTAQGDTSSKAVHTPGDKQLLAFIEGAKWMHRLFDDGYAEWNSTERELRIDEQLGKECILTPTNRDDCRQFIAIAEGAFARIVKRKPRTQQALPSKRQRKNAAPVYDENTEADEEDNTAEDDEKRDENYEPESDDDDEPAEGLASWELERGLDSEVETNDDIDLDLLA